jgi:RNA polymerase sigma factor (sigma-70 family)
MRDDPTVIALVSRVSNGDKRAWDELVERYAPLVWSMCRRHQMSELDAADVGQEVWLRLVEQLHALREPAALPGWLATTTHRECLRMIRSRQKRERLETDEDLEAAPDAHAVVVEQELLAAERDATLREAFAQLPVRCQHLLSLLMQDPPLPYAEISAKLGMPVGGIGPNRGRCLDALRRVPVLAALIDAEAQSAARGGERRDRPMVER